MQLAVSAELRSCIKINHQPVTTQPQGAEVENPAIRDHNGAAFRRLPSSSRSSPAYLMYPFSGILLSSIQGVAQGLSSTRPALAEEAYG